MWPFKAPLLTTTGEPSIAGKQLSTNRQRRAESQQFGQMKADQHLASFGIQPGGEHMGPQFDSDESVNI